MAVVSDRSRVRLRAFGTRLSPTLSPGDIFPDLEQEFGQYQRFFRARVLTPVPAIVI